ncbi:amidase [Cryobacterium sp. PH29-G1]|uniref:amidase n=1 Tax=Cryobacterium sp. PH29-G1 TaxID=3046211 RepID=UPI0024BA5AC1|nr:amidase [Cryobacterium sp. PH29-G1]MDJ0347924.1 amidase [Cryobacterium sp. PH29-G1]
MSLFAPWSLRELVEDLKTGRTTQDAARARSRQRIDETEETVRAWVDISFPERPSAEGALHGVPMGVKDIIDLHGFPTKCGSATRRDAAPAETDATIVSAWRAAGAVPIGKTVTTEFAFFQPGPTNNPAAPGHTPGGSSSGSAAAVASGQVPLALGSQTAGSVTRPASFCGVASLVMTHDRFPVDGITGLSQSLDSNGMFTADAHDLAVAWSALSGESIPPSAPPRLLLWDACTIGSVSGEMVDAVDRATRAFRADGAVVEVFPEAQLIIDCTAAQPIVMGYEAARERATELAMADRLSEPLRQLLENGARISDADYREARTLLARGRARIREVLNGCSGIVGAAALGAAPEGTAATGDPLLSRPWQAIGLPVATIPGLRSQAHLPLGIQLIGHPRGEAALLSTAGWIQDRLP